MDEAARSKTSETRRVVKKATSKGNPAPFACPQGFRGARQAEARLERRTISETRCLLLSASGEILRMLHFGFR
jgi:hypothetical protein